jgi:hypothetical protein
MLDWNDFHGICRYSGSHLLSFYMSYLQELNDSVSLNLPMFHFAQQPNMLVERTRSSTAARCSIPALQHAAVPLRAAHR